MLKRQLSGCDEVGCSSRELRGCESDKLWCIQIERILHLSRPEIVYIILNHLYHNDDFDHITYNTFPRGCWKNDVCSLTEDTSAEPSDLSLNLAWNHSARHGDQLPIKNGTGHGRGCYERMYIFYR